MSAGAGCSAPWEPSPRGVGWAQHAGVELEIGREYHNAPASKTSLATQWLRAKSSLGALVGLFVFHFFHFFRDLEG